MTHVIDLSQERAKRANGWFKRVALKVKSFFRRKPKTLAGVTSRKISTTRLFIKTFFQWYSFSFMLVFTLMVAAMMGISYFILCGLMWWGITSLLIPQPVIIHTTSF